MDNGSIARKTLRSWREKALNKKPPVFQLMVSLSGRADFRASTPRWGKRRLKQKTTSLSTDGFPVGAGGFSRQHPSMGKAPT
jgi:hypothetical protein